ncbi:unnamed protein product [Lymnaea stagnalis]|uniref:Uncharacterized protein n=1 Tax=Lymnaea stagnalis TaxID=6523 RepID=A0AAV2HAZ0_LYMST
MPVRGTPFPARGLRTGFNSSGRGFSKDMPINAGRGRGIGRAMMPQQRPATAPFTRPGPGMPIPMTGRQKMNEKMRRSNFGMAPGSNSLFSMPGNVLGTRGAAINSVGDSFKQEIASLQNQLERSTQVLEAKIAMLQQTTQSAAFYDEDVNVFEPGDWGDAEYNTGYSHENYSVDNGRYGNDNLMSFHFNNATSIRPRRSLAGAYAGSEPNMGQVTGHKPQMGPSRGSPSMRRGESRGGVRRGRGQMRGNSQTYW